MYSSPAQSSVTVPDTLSRKACAVGHWAASRRPAITTVPAAGPFSIVNIRLFRFSESYAARSLLGHVAVLERIHHLADEVDAEASRPSLFEGQIDISIRRLRHVEGFGIGIDDRHL